MEPHRIESLTWREIEVLRLLEARLSDEAIAEVLQLTPEAVRRFRSRIYRKLVIHTQCETTSEAESSDESPP